MSGYEKYVRPATMAVLAANYGPADATTEALVAGDMRIALAAVGPLIEEDTRDRMVTAAGRALEREKAQAEPAPKWSDLFGIDPDFTGEACSVDYVRWQRGAVTPVEFDHEDCWAFLLNDGKPLS